MIEDTVPTTPAGRPPVALSPGRLALRRFARHRLAVAGLVALVIVVLAAVIGPFLLGIDPNLVDPMAIRQAPSAAHLLGTDSAGRDVLARLLARSRVEEDVDAGLHARLLRAPVGRGNRFAGALR